MSAEKYPNQGSFITLYLDGTKTQRYETRSIHYHLHPTGIAVCTYNTPKTLNSLSLNQRWEFFLILEHMKKDEKVKVVIWTASGDRAFSAGADLKWDPTVFISDQVQQIYLNRNMGVLPGDMVLTNETLAFWDFPKPSIVAVNGLAIGGAANMALMNFHDFVILSEKARFWYPFPRLGFIPELGSSLIAPYVLGFLKTKELFFLSEWISAEETLKLGLANKVVKHEDLMKEAMIVAEKLVVLPPSALTFSKKVLNGSLRQKLEKTLKFEQEYFMKSIQETGGPMAADKYIKEKTKMLKQSKL